MNKTVFEVALAALLHDVGKPLQRAVKNDVASCQNADSYIKNNAKYSHAIWTSDFIWGKKEIFDNLIHNINEFDKLSSLHHNPENDSILQKIIQQADWASAGMDRIKYEQKKDDADAEETPENLIYSYG